METPSELRAAADEDELVIARREYDDEPDLIAIDLGPAADASLDVVGDTAIVVTGDEQVEFEVPGEASEITLNDGVLRIRA